jgi:hypothetical protein
MLATRMAVTRLNLRQLSSELQTYAGTRFRPGKRRK